MKKFYFIIAIIFTLACAGCSSTKGIYHDDGLIGKSNNRYAYPARNYCGSKTTVKKVKWYKPKTWELFTKK